MASNTRALDELKDTVQQSSGAIDENSRAIKELKDTMQRNSRAINELTDTASELRRDMNAGFEAVTSRLEILECYPGRAADLNEFRNNCENLGKIRDKLSQLRFQIVWARVSDRKVLIPILEECEREFVLEETEALKLIGSVLCWAPKRARTKASINRNELSFVNRIIPVNQIIEAWSCNFESAEAGRLQVPLIHTARGNGKTTLAGYVLDACKDSQIFQNCSSEFKKVIVNARKITLDLSKVAQGETLAWNYVLRDLFITEVEQLIKRDELRGSAVSLRRARTFEEAVMRFQINTQTPLLLFFDNLGVAVVATDSTDDSALLRLSLESLLKIPLTNPSFR